MVRHNIQNTLKIISIVSEKNLSLSSFLIYKLTDSVQVIETILKTPLNKFENLCATAKIPLKETPKKYEMIVLSDALIIHHEILLGIKGTEYRRICRGNQS